MQTSLDCVPCFLRQALQAARFVSDDPALHERVIRGVLKEVARMDLTQPPPAMAQRIHQELRRLTGSADPYRSTKLAHNQMALRLLPALRERVHRAEDPLTLAVRYSIMGNVIDLGAGQDLSEAELARAADEVLEEPFSGEVEKLREALDRARDILYLADNAGEIVFDRLLLEQLPTQRITLVVRGSPVLNDATREDALTAGLDTLVPIIDNGSDAPGTLLEDCTPAFRERFDRADLILSKGQGNYETLSDSGRPIFFLLKVKCPLAAQHIGLTLGTHALYSRLISP